MRCTPQINQLSDVPAGDSDPSGSRIRSKDTDSPYARYQRPTRWGVSEGGGRTRSNASEQAGQQARHPEKAPYDPFRMR